MTTTVRGRIPRLICASCISSALLISAGATTAIAATQSPIPVQQIPRDDSGGSSDSGDQSGNGSDTGNQLSNTNDHPNTPSDNGGGWTNDHPNTPSDNGGGWTNSSGHDNSGNQPPSNTGKQSSNDGGGAADLKRVCQNEGRVWVTTASGGYCGSGKTSSDIKKKDQAGTQKNDPDLIALYNKTVNSVNVIRVARYLPRLPSIPFAEFTACLTNMQCMMVSFPELFGPSQQG
ncbi:hypothetical protein ABT255_38160 [Streptomyces mirabilis]|uniref:hypothetical protein n=1 Tax=Streptomyces mirabilis TaxID=68239 RepID=UPI0033306730